MCPPGLGFATPNQKALDLAAVGARTTPTTSTGRRRSRASARTRRTARSRRPCRSSWRSTSRSSMIEDEGLENVFERHRQLGAAARAAVKALGLEIFGPEDERANVVTAFKVPEGVDGGKLPKILRDTYNITANGGQNQLKGKILRIAHTGYFGAFDIVAVGRRDRDGAARPGRRRRGRRGRRRRAARVPGGRRARRRSRRERPQPQGPRQGEDRRLGVELLRRAVRRRPRRRLGRRRAGRADRRLRRDPHPLGDQADRRPDRARRPHEGDRPRRHRRRQRRRRRPPPGAASSWPTRRRRTSSPRPSTRSR